MVDWTQIGGFLAQAGDAVEGVLRAGNTVDAGGTRMTYVIIMWTVIGVIILLLQLALAAWLFVDARKSGRSPVWALAALIPLVGIVLFFVYTLLEPAPKQTLCQKHQQPILPGQTGCVICMQEQVIQEQQQALMELRNQIQGIVEQRAPEHVHESHGVVASSGQAIDPGSAVAPGAKETAPLDIQPSTVISLQQIGGQRHGMTTNLATRDPLGRKLRNLIGRDASCALSIPDDDSVSQFHCSLGEAMDGSFYVADLDSTNGTFLIRNGEEKRVVGREGIQDGDVLRVGRTELRVIITEPPKKAAHA